MKKIKALDFEIPLDIVVFNSLFRNARKELYIVGGSVRDYLMNKTPHDFDLTTNATPDEVCKILKDFKCDLQGKQFAVIRVFTRNSNYEIASYRKDLSKGRDNKSDTKKVQIDNVSLEDDLKRRDFTMNSLVYDIENKEIIDFHDGIEHIKNKIVSTVGESSLRFSEDRLRIMRAVRFSARYDFNIDEQTKFAIKNDKRLSGISEIDDISKERIVEEMFKMWEYAVSKNDKRMLYKYFKLLKEFGLLTEMFPDIELNYNFVYSLNLQVILACLFIDNVPTKEFYSKLVYEFKLDITLAYSIIFLMKVKKQRFTFVNCYDMKKEQQKYNVSNDSVWELGNIFDFNHKDLVAFTTFKLSVKGDKFIADGYKGEDIGIRIKNEEIKNYINHYQNM